MVIAWGGPFEALCGFRPLEEIRYFLRGSFDEEKYLAITFIPNNCFLFLLLFIFNTLYFFQP